MSSRGDESAVSRDVPDDGSQAAHAEVTLAELAERLVALEGRLAAERERPQLQVPTAGLEAQVAQLARVVDRATASSESIARVWMAVPGVIGVIVVGIGLAILLSAFAWVNEGQFDAALWGGVVLVAVGALSATASALVARPDGLPASTKRPTMPPL